MSFREPEQDLKGWWPGVTVCYTTPKRKPSDSGSAAHTVQEHATPKLKPSDSFSAAHIIDGFKETTKHLDELISEIDGMSYERPCRQSIVDDLAESGCPLTIDRIRDPAWKDAFQPMIEERERSDKAHFPLRSGIVDFYTRNENGRLVLVTDPAKYAISDAELCEWASPETRFLDDIGEEDELLLEDEPADWGGPSETSRSSTTGGFKAPWRKQKRSWGGMNMSKEMKKKDRRRNERAGRKRME